MTVPDFSLTSDPLKSTNCRIQDKCTFSLPARTVDNTCSASSLTDAAIPGLAIPLVLCKSASKIHVFWPRELDGEIDCFQFWRTARATNAKVFANKAGHGPFAGKPFSISFDSGCSLTSKLCKSL